MSATTRLTAIAGGIGAGKSVVSRVLIALGYPVFDCDREARDLMDSSPAIKAAIAAGVCREAITADGLIDRRRLAETVFADSSARLRLNEIVHGAVRARLTQWRQSLNCRQAFVETAILNESGIGNMVDAVWTVKAPEDIRIRRIIERNGLSEAQARARIAVQTPPAGTDTVLVNDGINALLPQIEQALNH